MVVTFDLCPDVADFTVGGHDRAEGVELAILAQHRLGNWQKRI